MNKAIYFTDLELKEYEQPVGCPSIIDACNELKDLILQNTYSYLDDLVVEVADSNVDIYVSDLIKTCSSSSFLPYINDTIKEYGSIESVEELYSSAEYLYFYNTLYANMKSIIQNALIEFMKSTAIIVNADEKEIHGIIDKTKNYVNCRIEQAMPNDNVIDDFVANLSIYIDEQNLNESISLKISDAEDNTDEIRALFIEVGKEPQVIMIKDSLEVLQKLVDGNIEMVSLYDEDTRYGVDLVVNEEGKIINLPQNIVLREKHITNTTSNELVDIVMGNALIVGVDLSNGELTSLTEDKINKWSKEFSVKEKELPILGALYIDNEYNPYIFKDYDEKINDTIDFSNDIDR